MVVVVRLFYVVRAAHSSRCPRTLPLELRGRSGPPPALSGVLISTASSMHRGRRARGKGMERDRGVFASWPATRARWQARISPNTQPGRADLCMVG